LERNKYLPEGRDRKWNNLLGKILLFQSILLGFVAEKLANMARICSPFEKFYPLPSNKDKCAAVEERVEG
jgi:hypothetical protein